MIMAIFTGQLLKHKDISGTFYYVSDGETLTEIPFENYTGEKVRITIERLDEPTKAE